MRHIKTLLLFILILTLGNGVVTAQSSDEVVLQKPSENSSISNTFNIEWKIVDADIENPAYFIDVFNLACTQNGGNLGRITNSGANVENNIYTYSWDTNSGNLANSLQNGGNYCMRVCGILADGGSVYSKCDKKSFVYSSENTGTNKPPKITSAKESFNITINEVFSYKVEASDPDGDDIKFSFLNAPDFLEIDTESGQITGKPTEVGDIRFIVKVDDSKGGIVTEEFILNIQLTNTAKEVEFEFPKSDSVVTPDNNIIKWKVKTGIIVKTITLSFSADKEEWTEITKQDRDLGQYTWNINDVDEGEYYLRMLLVDDNNKLYEIISDQFNVSSQGAVSETQITDLNPEEGSTVSINRPQIRAAFKTPEGVTIDPEDVKFSLNERIDLTLCEITDSSINCEIVSELSNGSYTAFVEIKDSNGTTLVKEWKFTVNTSGEPSDESENTVGPSGNSTQLILIIFAVGFLLIALPWSIYLILKKRKNKKSETTKLPDNNVIHPITPVATGPTQPVIGTQGLDINTIPNTVTDNTTQNIPTQNYQPIVNTSDSFANPENVYDLTVSPENTAQQSTDNQVAPINGLTSLPSDISNQNANNIPFSSTSIPQNTNQGVQGLETNSATQMVENSVNQNMDVANMNQSNQIPGPEYVTPEVLPAENLGENTMVGPDGLTSQNLSVPNYNNSIQSPTGQYLNDIANPSTSSNSFDKPIITEQPAMYQQEEIPEWLKKDIVDTSIPTEPSTTTTLDDIVTKTEIQQGSKVYDPYGLALKTDETEDATTGS